MTEMKFITTYFGEFQGTTEEQFVYEKLGIFPHCDSRVLHKPGVCSVCDERPDWQALRMHWNINFTGESDPAKSQCPAEAFRSANMIHLWHGNRPNGV